jgi:hypothetical protein
MRLEAGSLYALADMVELSFGDVRSCYDDHCLVGSGKQKSP